MNEQFVDFRNLEDSPGLSISYGIIEQHHGINRIKAANKSEDMIRPIIKTV